MRSTLLGGLVANVRYNLNRKLARAGVRDRPRVRPGSGASGRRSRRRRDPPADAGRRDRLRPGARGAVGRRQRSRWTSSISRAMSKPCSRRGRRTSSRRLTRRCIPAGRPGSRWLVRRRVARRAASSVAAEVRAARPRSGVRARLRPAPDGTAAPVHRSLEVPGCHPRPAVVVDEAIPAGALLECSENRSSGARRRMSGCSTSTVEKVRSKGEKALRFGWLCKILHVH